MKKSEALNILGLKDGATDDEVKKAHRKLVIENHPDKFGDDAAKRDEAEEKTKLINEARDVLISRKWDPEYRTAGTPYADPFSYRPQYGGGTQGANPFDPFADGNPFAGFPFGGTTFVWTTYDPFTGKQTTYTTTGSGRPAGTTTSTNPGANPFGTGSATTFRDIFDAAMPADVLYDEIQKDLKRDYTLIAIKLAILILSIVLGAPGVGVFLWVIGSVGRAVWHNLRYLSLIFLVPLTMLAIIFAPAVRPNAVGVFALLVFVTAVVYDIRSILSLRRRAQDAKARMGK